MEKKNLYFTLEGHQPGALHNSWALIGLCLHILESSCMSYFSTGGGNRMETNVVFSALGLSRPWERPALLQQPAFPSLLPYPWYAYLYKTAVLRKLFSFYVCAVPCV